jgi:hypothetical protein
MNSYHDIKDDLDQDLRRMYTKLVKETLDPVYALNQVKQIQDLRWAKRDKEMFREYLRTHPLAPLLFTPDVMEPYSTRLNPCS